MRHEVSQGRKLRKENNQLSDPVSGGVRGHNPSLHGGVSKLSYAYHPGGKFFSSLFSLRLGSVSSPSLSWPVLGESKGCGCKVCGAASAKQTADDSVAAELCHRLGSPFYPAALRIPSRLDPEEVWEPLAAWYGWMDSKGRAE